MKYFIAFKKNEVSRSQIDSLRDGKSEPIPLIIHTDDGSTMGTDTDTGYMYVTSTDEYVDGFIDYVKYTEAEFEVLKTRLSTGLSANNRIPKTIGTLGLAAAGGYSFRGEGIIKQIIASTDDQTIIDIALPENKYIDGASFKAEGCNWDDDISFQIIHPVSGAILIPYVSNWGVDTSYTTIRVYKGLIYAGLVLRMIYNKTGTHTPKLRVNAFFHVRE